MTKRWAPLIVCLLLAIFTALSVGSALKESLTFDEVVHIQEGKNAWLHHTFAIDTNNPPLTRELAVIPLLLGSGKIVHSSYPNIQILPARLIIVAFGIVLGIAIFIVGQQLFGTSVGVLALFFYVFEPNTLAHSHYVTQDMGAAAFFFFAYISLLKMFKKPTIGNFILHGILVGCMATAKVTLLPYYFFSACIVTLYLLGLSSASWFLKNPGKVIVSIVCCLFVIWTTYFFKMNVIVAPSDAKGRVSTQLELIAKKQHNVLFLDLLNTLRHQPMPLGDYIAILKNAAVRSTHPTTYFFLGSFYSNPKWYFMIVNSLYKTPIALLLLFLFGGIVATRGKRKRRSWMILCTPIIAIFTVASVSRLQPLVRFALPAYPFIILVAAASLTFFKKTYQKIILLVLCVWYVAGTLGSFPHFLSYTNELAGSGNQRVLRFLDSNIDWGQSLISFASYVRKVQPRHIEFSYFGRDDAAKYGLASTTPYGSYKNNEICAFHSITLSNNKDPTLTAISESNWYYCDYYKMPQYMQSRIRGIVGDTILIF